jgi:hypothetical protein
VQRSEQAIAASLPWPTRSPVDLFDLLAPPLLPAAACKARWGLFDRAAAKDPAAVEQAQACCESCPALTPCREWIASTPEHLRPTGIVGGVVPAVLAAAVEARPQPTIAAPQQPRQRPSSRIGGGSAQEAIDRAQRVAVARTKRAARRRAS